MSTKWDARFIAQAKLVSTWSKDPSTQVGAVIVDGHNRMVSQGFNGFARSVKDSPARLKDRTKKYRMVLHAECNALLFATRDLRHCSIYVWPILPCAQCAAMIIQVGIERVVSLPASNELNERWGDDIAISCQMFHEARVEVNLL